MSYPIKSILEQIATEVFQMKSIVDIQDYVVKFINEHSINDKDKNSIIKNINECRNVNAAHRYIANALLKYEGLSPNLGKKEVSNGVIEDVNE